MYFFEILEISISFSEKLQWKHSYCYREYQTRWHGRKSSHCQATKFEKKINATDLHVWSVHFEFMLPAAIDKQALFLSGNNVRGVLRSTDFLLRCQSVGVFARCEQVSTSNYKTLLLRP